MTAKPWPPSDVWQREWEEVALWGYSVVTQHPAAGLAVVQRMHCLLGQPSFGEHRCSIRRGAFWVAHRTRKHDWSGLA